MELSEYQQAAAQTSQLRNIDPLDAVAPMLGLASETGAILNVYKKFLRDGIDLAANRDFLLEELGDLLWYTAAVASAFDLNLEEIAKENLRRTRDRYPIEAEAHSREGLPVFDGGYPVHERFPRRMVFQFLPHPSATPAVTIRLVSAEPNAFPEGREGEPGKMIGYEVGATIGNPLTDNARREDAYRFHDAVHMGFLSVLGWSATLRGLLRIKRKSNPQTDEAEDGARAVFAEEGLAAVLARMAKRRTGFLSPTSVDGEVLEIVRAITAGLEVEQLPEWLWREAIAQGFGAMRQLADADGGFLVCDLTERRLSYSAELPD